RSDTFQWSLSLTCQLRDQPPPRVLTRTLSCRRQTLHAGPPPTGALFALEFSPLHTLRVHPVAAHELDEHKGDAEQTQEHHHDVDEFTGRTHHCRASVARESADRGDRSELQVENQVREKDREESAEQVVQPNESSRPQSHAE